MSEYKMPIEHIYIDLEGQPHKEFAGGPLSIVTHPGFIEAHFTECEHAAFMRKTFNEQEFLEGERQSWQIDAGFALMFPLAKLKCKGLG